MNADPTLAELWARMPPASREVCRYAAELAAARGQSVFLVGGSVRDLLLGTGSTDLDLVTEGDSVALAEALAGKLGGSAGAPSQFMTVLVELPEGRRVDVAAARQETYPEPTKLPRVAPADIATDLRRRDFSLNALAVRLGPEGAEGLVDPCGGREDLAAGVVRVLHDRSFVDDPTRLLRAARFSTRFGFALEARTAALLREAAEARLLGCVTGARVRHEVVKLLCEPDPWAAAQSVTALGLAQHVLPGYRPTRRTGEWLARASLALAALGDAPSRRWPYLLGLLAVWADAPAVAQRLDLDGEAADIVLAMHEAAQVRLPAALVGHREVSGRALDRALNGTPLPGLVVLWLRSGPAGRRRLERYVTRLRLTAPTITGHDLRAAGVPDGPAMAVGLQAACEVRRDGPATRQAQLQAALAAIREWQRPARRAQRKG